MAQIFNGTVHSDSPGISTTVNYEYTRDGAVAPEVTFKSVDPQRTDKRFVSYSLEVVAA